MSESGTEPLECNAFDSAEPGREGVCEFAFPLSLIEDSLLVSLAICGGDFYHAGDILPDDSLFTGNGTTEIRNFILFKNPGASGVSPCSSFVIRKYTITPLSLLSFSVSRTTFSRYTMVEVSFNNECDVKLEVFSEKGKKILEMNQRGENVVFPIDGSRFERGIYILKLSADGRVVKKYAVVKVSAP